MWCIGLGTIPGDLLGSRLSLILLFKSRDDQNEYERRQRQALRVQQAQIQEMSSQQEKRRRNIEDTHRRSPSPPPVMIFSNATVGQVAEKLKSEEHFSTTVTVSII